MTNTEYTRASLLHWLSVAEDNLRNCINDPRSTAMDRWVYSQMVTSIRDRMKALDNR